MIAEPTSEPLTAEAVAALADGTPIIVTWGGGNGPGSFVLRGADAGGGRLEPVACGLAGVSRATSAQTRPQNAPKEAQK